MTRKPSSHELANRQEFSNSGKTNYFSAYNEGIIHASFWQEAVQRHLQAASPLLKIQNPVIIDAGGAGGRIAQKFSEAFPKARVELLDINPDMLSFAHEVNGIPQKNVHVSDVTAMKYGGTSIENGTAVPDHSVDHVISNSVLWILDEPQLFFAETARVLKKGGRLSIASGTPDFNSAEKRAVFIAQIESDLGAAVAKGSVSSTAAEIIINANKSITASMNSLLTSEQAIAMAEKHGLKCISQDKVYVDMFFFLVFEKQ